MFEQQIEDVINDVLIGNAKKNALEFVAYLRTSDMQFEIEKGYWEDKYYWGIKYNNEYVCFILISSEDKTDPEIWTIWSDDSGSVSFGDDSLNEHLKEIIWNHVGVCENVNKCFDGCKKSHKTIFGKGFDNVCGTAMRFYNPDNETLECLKIIVEVRKNNILKNI